MRFWGILLMCIVFLEVLRAQEIQPIGFWQEHLPWGNAHQVILLGNELVCATDYGVFKYDLESREFLRKSKVNGFSDIGISAIAVDEVSGSIIIAYKSKIIDIWVKDQVFTIPDLKITNVPGDFFVNSILVKDGFAYLSTNAGILLLNIQKHEIKERWFPGLVENQWSTSSICLTNNYWYASTKSGLKKLNSSKDGSDPQSWEFENNVPWPSSAAITKVLNFNNSLIAWVGNDIYRLIDGGFQKIYGNDFTIYSMDVSNEGLLVSHLSTPISIDFIGNDFSVKKTYRSFDLINPKSTLIVDGECWVADHKRGLLRINDNSSQKVYPDGPEGFATGDIKFINGSIWVASGTVNEDWKAQGNKLGIYKFDNRWQTYNKEMFKALDSLADIIKIAYQPKTGKIFGASFGGGLLEIDQQDMLKVYKYNSGLGQYPTGSGAYNVSGLATDDLSNLWISNFGSPQQLHLLKADGGWYSFNAPFSFKENAVGEIILDDFNQKWIISPKGGGLLVWNTGNLPENPNDDKWRLFTKGIGSGNLPSNNVLCVVKDRNGLIWVGTDNGIGIFNCTEDVFNNSCEAILPVVDNANQTGFLFQNQKVNALAVDGANRKWIGTSKGLWLISDDGEKLISHFTVENSKLLSNEIYSLGLNPLTGELYVATSNGICSYMGNATENIGTAGKILVFPNPVPPGYSGVIAIRGLPENSWVKITEINGRLVYQGKSLGGQMVWNGKDGNGRAVSSGVYLVISTDDLHQEKAVAKIFLTK